MFVWPSNTVGRQLTHVTSTAIHKKVYKFLVVNNRQYHINYNIMYEIRPLYTSFFAYEIGL